MQEAKQKYIAGLKEYHQRLSNFVKDSYLVDPKYLEVISWGYHTTAIYIKASNNREYLLKLANRSVEKEQGILKDIELSNKLRGVIPTPIYIKNLSDNYICRFEDKILRLSHYISGLSPLDMDFNILEQMVDVLKKIHGTAHSDSLHNGVLLHGDLTPHNVLVSFGKIVATMDFELAFIGLREWDLARTTVFSWSYMKSTSFEQVARFVLEKYMDDFVDSDLFFKYAIENAQRHLDSVEKHRNDYDRQKDWEKDYAFAQRQIATLRSR